MTHAVLFAFTPAGDGVAGAMPDVARLLETRLRPYIVRRREADEGNEYQADIIGAAPSGMHDAIS